MSNTSSPSLFKRLILTPMRLKSGWGRPARRLGLLGISMLVLLRVCVGFHFYTEGIDKIDGGFDAGKFFAGARGPFAEQFQKQIWDWDGNIRLDQERTFNWWDIYTTRAKKHFGFDKKQLVATDEASKRTQAQLEWILQSNQNEIEEFRLGKSRLEDLNREVMRDSVSSLGAQRDTIRKDWQRLIAPVFVQVDKAWTNLESEVNDIATSEQKANRGVYKLGKPRDVAIDTSVINPLIPFFDLAVGVCLILGLGVPVVALAAAVFLGSVFMSQFPPESGPGSTYYQLVEGAACLVLAATGAGRFAGLDFIFYAISTRLWPSNSER
jgi:uncharacterized membrane protein YphA (DoxX/SURF4 family)